nr:MAG TPA: major capsid protein [Caudoviricetes sp.]
MAAKNNVTTTGQFSTSVREVDFVTRFADNWDALRNIMGIMRPIRKAPGTKLVSYKASVDGTLQGGTSVAEGDEIPFTKMKVEPVSYADIEVAKYAKSVTLESVAKYGADVAVEKTDDAFLVALQNKILGEFYTFLGTGTLTLSETTWQRALAMAKGKVLDKFAGMDKDVTEIVGFANILDAYDYLGDKEITVQTVFGLNYVENFLGYRTLFLLPDKYIAQGTVIALPVENIDLYYVDPGDSDFAKLGLNYTVKGETNLIGVHVEGDYSRATGDMYAIMGMKLWAEYLDGIAVATVGAQTLGTLTVTSAAGTSSGNTKITVSPAKANAGNVYKYKVGSAAETVTYGQNVKTWTAWDGTSDITAASNQKITVVEAGSDYKALKAGNATVTAK